MTDIPGLPEGYEIVRLFHGAATAPNICMAEIAPIKPPAPRRWVVEKGDYNSEGGRIYPNNNCSTPDSEGECVRVLRELPPPIKVNAICDLLDLVWDQEIGVTKAIARLKELGVEVEG